MVIFNSYVKLPEGISDDRPKFFEGPCHWRLSHERTLSFSFCKAQGQASPATHDHCTDEYTKFGSSSLTPDETTNSTSMYRLEWISAGCLIAAFFPQPAGKLLILMDETMPSNCPWQ